MEYSEKSCWEKNSFLKEKHENKKPISVSFPQMYLSENIFCWKIEAQAYVYFTVFWVQSLNIILISMKILGGLCFFFFFFFSYQNLRIIE